MVKLGLRRLDPGGLGHRSQGKVNLDGGDRLLTELGYQLLEGAPKRFQVALQRHALGVEAAAKILGVAADLDVNEDRRGLVVHEGCQRLEGGVAQRQGSLGTLHLPKAGFYVGAELVNRRELGRLGGPFVSDFRQDLLLYLFDDHLYLDLFIAKRCLEAHSAAGFGAGQVLVELG